MHLALKHLVLDVITGIKINETAPWPLYFLHRLFQLHVKMIFLCCFFFFCWLEESAVLFCDLVCPTDLGWSCVCSEIMHNLEQEPPNLFYLLYICVHICPVVLIFLWLSSLFKVVFNNPKISSWYKTDASQYLQEEILLL